MGPKGQQTGNRGGQRLLTTCARWGAVARWRARARTGCGAGGRGSRRYPCSARPAGGLASKLRPHSPRWWGCHTAAARAGAAAAGPPWSGNLDAALSATDAPPARARVNDLRARHPELGRQAWRPRRSRAKPHAADVAAARPPPSPTASVPCHGTWASPARRSHTARWVTSASTSHKEAGRPRGRQGGRSGNRSRRKGCWLDTLQGTLGQSRRGKPGRPGGVGVGGWRFMTWQVQWGRGWVGEEERACAGRGGQRVVVVGGSRCSPPSGPG